MGIETALIITGVSMAIGAKMAHEEGVRQRQSAARDKEATDKVIAANQAFANTQATSDTTRTVNAFQQAQDAAAIAQGEIQSARELANQNYARARTQLETSRNYSAAAAAAMGGRGAAGGATSSGDRALTLRHSNAAGGLSDEISARREQASLAERRVTEQLENAEDQRNYLLGGGSYTTGMIGAQKARVDAGLEYDRFAIDEKVRRVNEETEFNWLKGGLSGMSAGFNISSGLDSLGVMDVSKWGWQR